jgi:hypothetical protein
MGPVGKKCALEVDSFCLLMFSSPSTYGLPIPRHVTAYENTRSHILTFQPGFDIPLKTRLLLIPS